MHFGGGGVGEGSSGLQEGSPNPATDSTFQTIEKPQNPQDTITKIVKPDTLKQTEQGQLVFSEIKIAKRGGVLIVLLDGKPRDDWKQAVKESFARNPKALFLTVAGNVSYAEAQAVKDYLLAEKIDFVD